jgi:heptaprenyl diphosphate synthase
MQSNNLKKTLILTTFVTIGLILFSLESLLPQPIPGGKIGLSQIVTLLVLVWFGWPEALLVVLFRVLIGNLILGTLFNPIFLLSFSGALVSLVVMSVVYYKFKSFGIVGISILGAVFHNIAQLLLAYLFIIKQVEIFWLLPYFVWISIFSGLLIGLAAWILKLKIQINAFL